jgi:hypothetical protein
MIFIASDQSAKVLHPADRALDFPASLDSTQLATVLGRRFAAVGAVSANQFDLSPGKTLSQRITVGGLIVKQSLWPARDDSRVEQRIDQGDFVGTGTGDGGGDRQAGSFTMNHDLGALAPLGLADVFSPFFAEANVPSAVDSFQSSLPWRSSFRSPRAHACDHAPVFVHSWCRRQQVLGDGKLFGKSFQRAPVRSTQRMPSTQRRDSSRGRPPLADGWGFTNTSSIKSHCSSLSSDSGSVLDPAKAIKASLARDRTHNMCCLLSTALPKQLACQTPQ